MRILPSPEQAEPAERAIAIGTFDGVHRGHRAVIETAKTTGLRSTVLTFAPHPRAVLGYEVQLLATLERRIDLIGEIGPDELLVVDFTPELSRRTPDEFVNAVLRPLGARIVVAGEGFRFGAGRRGDLALLRDLGFDVRPVPLVDGVSSSQVRELLRAGEVVEAARLLGRPPELDGTVVAGDQRGGTLGFPTANLAVQPELLVPAHGIYAGQALLRAPADRPGATAQRERYPSAVSIGVNPHYGGVERRIEAFLLDFEGDLYGERLRLELWRRLREERAFASEAELVEQIARDAEAARTASRPV